MGAPAEHFAVGKGRGGTLQKEATVPLHCCLPGGGGAIWVLKKVFAEGLKILRVGGVERKPVAATVRKLWKLGMAKKSGRLVNGTGPFQPVLL